MKKSLESIWNILEKSFNPELLRSKNTLKRMLESGLCHYLMKTDRKTGKALGVVLWYRFSDFIFFEYLAVSPEARNKGIGEKMLTSVLKNERSKAILEVEEPKEENDFRRISFYERIGFHLSSFSYETPSFRPGLPPVHLRLMSYPAPLDQEAYHRIRETIFHNLYLKQL